METLQVLTGMQMLHASINKGPQKAILSTKGFYNKPNPTAEAALMSKTGKKD